MAHIILSLADKTCDWERTKRLNGVSKSQYDRVTLTYSKQVIFRGGVKEPKTSVESARGKCWLWSDKSKMENVLLFYFLANSKNKNGPGLPSEFDKFVGVPSCQNLKDTNKLKDQSMMI
jgi:hypothetical protein